MATNDKKTSKKAEPAVRSPVSEPAAPAAKPVAGLIAAYTLGRFAVFAVLAVIFYLVGLRGLPGLVAAAIVSIPVSFFLLSKTRVAVATRLAERKHAELSRKDEFRNAGK